MFIIMVFTMKKSQPAMNVCYDEMYILEDKDLANVTLYVNVILVLSSCHLIFCTSFMLVG